MAELERPKPIKKKVKNVEKEETSVVIAKEEEQIQPLITVPEIVTEKQKVEKEEETPTNPLPTTIQPIHSTESIALQTQAQQPPKEEIKTTITTTTTHDFSELQRLTTEAPSNTSTTTTLYGSTIVERENPQFAVVSATQSYPELNVLVNNQEPALQQQQVEKEEQKEEEEEEQHWIDSPGELEGSKFYELCKEYRKCLVAMEELQKDLSEMGQKAAKLSQEKVWTIENKTIHSVAQCRDGVSVSKPINYLQATLNQSEFNQLRNELGNLRACSSQTLPLRLFASLMAKTRIQLYIDEFISGSEALRSISSDEKPFTITNFMTLETIPHIREDISQLQYMLTVLFYFERNRPESIHPSETSESSTSALEMFYFNIRKWIISLGGFLIRRATSLNDHLFLLQHLICCPGIGSWGSCLLQFPLIQSTIIAEHFVNVASVFVKPISKSSQTPQTPLIPNEAHVMPSEDQGGGINRKFQILEEDFLALFEQLPFGRFCSYLLFQNYNNNTGGMVYQLNETSSTTSSSTLMADLLSILCQALRKVTIYKRFAKMITKIITTLLNFVANSRTSQTVSTTLGFNVPQKQFDSVFLSTAESILKVTDTSLWQFLCELPFSALSEEATWKTFGLLQFIPKDKLPKSNEEWVNARENYQPSPLSTFSEACSTEDGTFLTQAIAEIGKKSSSTTISIACIHALFHVAVVDRRCRALVFKSVCSLLASICESGGISNNNTSNNTSLISNILELLNTRLNEGDVHPTAAKHLISSLPLSLWTPNESDFIIISSWLMNSELNSPKNISARTTLQKANLAQSTINVTTHRKIAFLIVNAWLKHSSIISNVSIFNVGAHNLFNEFQNWCWERLYSLQYFKLSHLDIDNEDPSVVGPSVEHVKGIFSGSVSQKASQPMLIFVACMLSPFGSDPQGWVGTTQPMLILLKHLIHHQKSEAASLILMQIIPKLAERDGIIPGIITAHFLDLIKSIALSSVSSFPLSFLFSENKKSGGGGGNNSTNGMNLIESIIRFHLSLPSPISGQLAEFWLHVSAFSPSNSTANTWIFDDCCQKIASLVLEYWFTFQSKSIPSDLFTILQSLLPKVEIESGKSILPIKPVLTNFFGVPLLSFNESSWLTYSILHYETVIDTPRRQALISAKTFDFQTLKVVQWANYSIGLSENKDNNTELVVVFWQATIHLFFDFVTGLRPFRFHSSREFQELQHKMIENLELLGKDFISSSDENTTKRNIGNFFLTASKAVSTRVSNVSTVSELLGLLPPNFASNELFTLCLTQSPFSDPLTSIWTGLISLKPSKTAMIKPIISNSSNKNNSNPSNKNNTAEDSIRRLSIMLSPIEAPNIVQALPVVLPLPLEEKIVLPSLSEDLSRIGREAAKHYARVTQIEKLDYSYFSLLQALYVNYTDVIRDSKPCKEVGCLGPAQFVIQIIRSIQDPNVIRNMNENRTEATKLVQEKTIDIGLCASVLQIENTISRLLFTLQQEEQNQQQSASRFEHFHLCTRLLQTLFSVWESAIQTFAPVKSVFESCLMRLASLIVSESAEEAFVLLRTMLSRPQRIQSMARFFTPSLNRFSFASLFKETINVYSTTISSLPNKQLFIPLIERFSVTDWLNLQQEEQSSETTTISEEDKKIVLNSICDGLKSAKDDNRTQTILLSSFNSLITPSFPSLLMECMNALLRNSSNQELPPSVWTELLRQPFNLVTPTLSQQILKAVSNELQRLRSFKRMPLYSCWIQYYSSFVALISTILQSVIPQIQIQKVDRNMAIEIFSDFLNVHEPWISQQSDSGQPWNATQTESGMAATILSSLNSVVLAFQSLLSSSSDNGIVMKIVWDFYTSGNSAVICGRAMKGRQPPAVFVREQILESMIQLPWKSWHPDPPSIAEALVSIQASFISSVSSPTLFKLFGSVISSVEWNLVPIGNRVDVYGMLLQLMLVVCRGISAPIPKDMLSSITNISESIDWKCVPTDAIVAVLTEFVDSFSRTTQQPNTSTNTNNTNNNNNQESDLIERWIFIFRIAAASCGMFIRQQQQQQPATKGNLFTSFISPICNSERLTSLSRFYVSLICQNLVPVNVCSIGLTGTIVRASRELAIRDGSQSFAPSVQVLFGLYNVSGEPSTTIASEMVALSIEQPVLSPFLVAIACRSIASSVKLANAIEGFLNAHFTLSKDWQIISDALTTPQIDETEFISNCLEEGLFLTLFALLQAKLRPNNANIVNISAEITSWISKVKIKPGREQLFLLLLSIHLELIGSLAISQQQAQQTLAATIARRETLHGLAMQLTHLGEDRKTGGLVGFLGIGEKSVFSPAFRMTMKIISAFIFAQTPENTNIIRLRPEEQQGKTLSKLQSSIITTLHSKEYVSAVGEQVVENAVKVANEAINSPGFTLIHSRFLIGQLASVLFPQCNSLFVLTQMPGNWIQQC